MLKNRFIATRISSYIRKMNGIIPNIITFDHDQRSGQPCIRGMRITVGDILSYLAAGMSMEEIIEDFPSLTREDIYAALTFASNQLN